MQRIGLARHRGEHLSIQLLGLVQATSLVMLESGLEGLFEGHVNTGTKARGDAGTKWGRGRKEKVKFTIPSIPGPHLVPTCLCALVPSISETHRLLIRMPPIIDRITGRRLQS